MSMGQTVYIPQSTKPAFLDAPKPAARPRHLHPRRPQCLQAQKEFFLFEDFELSTKCLNAVTFDNLKHATKIAVHYPQEAEGTVETITAIRDCPDLSGFYGQSNAFLPDAESRLRRALVSFNADPNDNFTLAYNIATHCTSFYQSVDPNRLVSVPSNLLPSR
jgi:hypothetical protein